jgi:hypothetical protein
MSASPLQAALYLAEEYGVPVFPCGPNKQPCTEHGFKDASTNIEAIDHMWEGHPDALVAVPTGTPSRYLVIDVDPEGMGWYRQHLEEFKCGRTHHTRRGGVHLLYRYPAEGLEIRNSAGKLAPGIDVRGEGGYVIWWPACGLQAVGDLEDLTPPPDWLLEQLKAAGNGSSANGGHAEAAHIGEGRRNAYLSDEAYRQRRQGASIDDVITVLRTINTVRCRPPLADAEIINIARGKEGIEPDAPAWAPPTITIYGADFDAAKIPQRRWLLGRRRSIGELTVDVGPPGVNKSTLLLTDAVAIATGRKILGDEVHECGAVRFLAGEDARRDVESRLAGILARYNIAPTELAGRLQVVYLTEHDARTYCLAQMIDDLAVLNTSMFDWLREAPGILATFIDPILAWHRLIENSNEAMQVMSSSLRAFALRANQHVGIDHHVTKASMYDSEAHVGNLAAVRGGGSLAADARWAFTVARLKTDTAETYGIPEAENKRYRRLDPLKASYGADDDTLRLLRVESVPIANGESVGVLVEVDMQRTREEAQERDTKASEDLRGRRIAALTRMLNAKHPRSAQSAAAWIASHCPELFPGRKGEPLSVYTLRLRTMPAFIGTGLDTTHNGKPDRIVMREPEQGGKASEIDFEQTQVPI